MTSSSLMPDLFERGCGERLRDARNAAGLSVLEVSRRLRMPTRVIEALEAEDWERLDAPVYVRGQLRSYARLLGVDIETSAPAPLQTPVAPASIRPRTYTPPMRRVADKLLGRMVYVVITALIAVPVWMATRTHFDSSATLASLEPETQAATRSEAGTQPPPRVSARPLTASMAPMPRAAAAPAAVERAPAPISLSFSDDSWVEIFDPDGDRIEQGLLKAGEQREYQAGSIARVVLGNASAVEVRRDGRIQDLSAFQRANVARFTVSSDGSLAPVAE